MRHVELSSKAAVEPRVEAELTGELVLRREGAPPLAVKLAKARLRDAALAMPCWHPDKRRLAIEAGNATPETRAKVKRDVCESLVKRKQPLLDKEHLLAVEEIRDIHAAWARIGYASGNFAMRVDGGKMGDPLDRIPARVARAYQRNYLPWLRELAAEPIEQETPQLRRVFLCAPLFAVAIVVDNLGLNDAERRFGFPRDKGLGGVVLRIALERYLLWMQMKRLDKAAETRAFDEAA